MNKIPNGEVIDEASASIINALSDTSILSSELSPEPVTVYVDNVQVNVTNIELYNSRVEERKDSKEKVENVDVILLTIMWVCLAIAMFLSVFICVTISCRRVLVRSFKVANMQGVETYQITTDGNHLETQCGHNGPYEERNSPNKLWKQGRVVSGKGVHCND